MRRLAKQSRDDVYSSTRDYQELHSAIGQQLVVRDAGDHQIKFVADVTDHPAASIIAVGVYLKPTSAITVQITISAAHASSSKNFHLTDQTWNRLGLNLDSTATEEAHSRIEVTLRWRGDVSISVWGLAGGLAVLPDSVQGALKSARDLNQTHLAPETYYLIHDEAIGMDIDEVESSPFSLSAGASITLKKCSYCQRLLPVDANRLGVLSFHKHNAKRTRHQNECRSCKKWRINDNFNPVRTVDQLHESSVITRERKLFLREPERLQEIKRRDGAGLKSQVWERFGRKCFYCDKPLTLAEVQLDHTRPLASLWPIDEYATCLCAEHNNQKSDRFPIDFYSREQLQRLSVITGLSLSDLSKREINPVELERVRANVVAFALEWEPRTFAATARKVVELKPEVDLLEELRLADQQVFEDLLQALAERPASIDATIA